MDHFKLETKLRINVTTYNDRLHFNCQLYSVLQAKYFKVYIK